MHNILIVAAIDICFVHLPLNYVVHAVSTATAANVLFRMPNVIVQQQSYSNRWQWQTITSSVRN